MIKIILLLLSSTLLFSQSISRTERNFSIGIVPLDILTGSYCLYGEFRPKESDFSFFLSPSIKTGSFNSAHILFQSSKKQYFDPFSEQDISDKVDFNGLGIELGFKYYLFGSGRYRVNRYNNYMSFRVDLKHAKMNYFTEGWMKDEDNLLYPGTIWQESLVDNVAFDMSFGGKYISDYNLSFDYYIGAGLQFSDINPKHPEIISLRENIFTREGVFFVIGCRINYLFEYYFQ